MAATLVQAGSGPVRDLWVGYLMTAGTSRFAAEQLGPAACVWAEVVDPSAYQDLGQLTPLDQLVAEAGGFEPKRVLLAGFSAGCQAVRAHLASGARPWAAFAADGLHIARGSVPARQTEPWRAYVADGGRLRVSYSEVPATQFQPTRASIAQVFGVDTSCVGPPSAPCVQRLGRLWVYGARGSDGPAHLAQRTEVLPRMLADTLAERTNVWGAVAAGAALALGARWWATRSLPP